MGVSDILDAGPLNWYFIDCSIMAKLCPKMPGTFLQGHPHHQPLHTLTHALIVVVHSDDWTAWKEAARCRQVSRVSPLSPRPKSEGHLQKVRRSPYTVVALPPLHCHLVNL